MNDAANDDITDGIGTYDVVLLVERELSAGDASRVHSLHDEIEDQVVYHVLLPTEHSDESIEGAMATLATADPFSVDYAVADGDSMAEIQADEHKTAGEKLARSLGHLRESGAKAEGRVVGGDVISALASTSKQIDAREVIVLTAPHVVAEFFHTDWTSKARRKLDVPVLHLIEQENFDEQADGPGEGITGL